MAETPVKRYGLLAQFPHPHALYQACEKVRDAGYTAWDAHTPFPVHGLDKAMGLPRSRLPFIVLVMALFGLGSAFGLQAWIHAVDYPLIISGKPFFSWQAFVPVTFEATILFSALAAVFGMLHLNRLPRHYHSLFRSERFERATDDAFFISIEARDPKFDGEQTRALLEQIGGQNVELIDD